VPFDLPGALLDTSAGHGGASRGFHQGDAV